VTFRRRAKPPSDGELLFPPIAFITYQNSKLLQVGALGLNLGHRFAGWLLETSSHLASFYPGIARAIKANLFGDWYFGGRDGQAESLRASLDRLAELDPTLRVPSDAMPVQQDFCD
jgi:hypothetical protein